MFGTCPLATGSSVGSATDPAGGGACTVTTDVPLLPSLVAVIVVVPPSATSVTSPVADTVMIVGVLDAHATARPVSVVPLASLSVTFSWMVPWSGSVAGVGLTTTVVTGTSVSVTAALPAFPSLVAVLVAVPAATPFTSPLLLTVAILVLLLAHVTVRPVSALPPESFGVAMSCTVCPTWGLAVAGETATEATGAGAGGVQGEPPGLQTAALPTLAYSPRLFSTLGAACSVRKAKFLPKSCSAASAGVT